MDDVVVLALTERGGERTVRVPVRACVDALRRAGARAEAVVAGSDQEIDEQLAALAAGRTRLVVAAGADGQLRAVLRRMVRRWTPSPANRPADLPAHRTLPDLPPVGVLPLDPTVGPAADASNGSADRPAGDDARRDLACELGLPRTPAEVADAVLAGHTRRVDLLRQDGPSAVTLDGALLGGSDQTGRAVPWRARIEVDDAVLATGDEPLLAAVVANAGGYRRPDGLPLLVDADPADGVVEAAVAVPVPGGRWRRRVRVEVRRARGRAVVVHPAGDGVACLDDGVAGELTRQRSWWVEAGAWAVYTR